MTNYLLRGGPRIFSGRWLTMFNRFSSLPLRPFGVWKDGPRVRPGAGASRPGVLQTPGGKLQGPKDREYERTPFRGAGIGVKQDMDDRFSQTLVTACAATLAGLKCGSMFSFREREGEDAAASAAGTDAILRSRGVRVRILGRSGEGKLIYVYRPAGVERRLRDEGVRKFLLSRGYDPDSLEKCLGKLSASLGKAGAFPHEVGIFLDYPLGDVIGFIEQGSRACVCSGCWKAYGDPGEAMKRFEMYSRCRRVYADCWRRGFDLRRLTVAA